MKPPTIAPFYGCLYPGLCDVARQRGYALAIHGSVVTDLDLIACPWKDDACSAEELVEAVAKHINACDYRGLLERECTWASPKEIDQMVLGERERSGEERGPGDYAIKPHGRKAWNLYLAYGVKIDLSVMPRI